MTSRVYHVTVGFPHVPLTKALVAAASQEGFVSTALPESWPYPRIATIDKFRLVSGFIALNGLRDHDIVLFTDAYDVLVLRSAEEIVKRFRATAAALVFNAEANLFPDSGREAIRAEFDRQTDSPSRYLNSGCYVGYTWAIKAMLDWCLARAVNRSPRDHALDQELAQDYWLARLQAAPGQVVLDVHSQIFATLMKREGAFSLWQGRVTSVAGDCCVLHANGDKRNLVALDNIYGLLYPDGDRKIHLDLRSVTVGGKPVAFNPEHYRLDLTESPSELSVFLLVLGLRFSIALTARTGPLTFHPSRPITCGALVMAEWEVLLGADNPRTMHGDCVADRIGTPLETGPIALGIFALPWAKDLIRHVRLLDQSAIAPSFGDAYRL